MQDVYVLSDQLSDPETVQDGDLAPEEGPFPIPASPAHSYRLYSSLPQPAGIKTFAAIDLNALRFNYRTLRRRIRAVSPSCRMIGVLKADAYGHGADDCCRALLREGCDFFAVSCIEEAVAVRKIVTAQGASADILVLGFVPPEEVSVLAERDIIATVFSAAYAKRLSDCAREKSLSVRVHLKLDTGMNRLGFCAHDPDNEQELETVADELAASAVLPGLSVEGMFTHFAFAGEDEVPGRDSTEDLCRRQAQAFQTVASKLASRGVLPTFLHICNSAGALRFPEYHFSGVRIGIHLYGFEAPDLPLRPVMRLISRIVHLHKLSPGETVGYGGVYTAKSERLVATVPIGYADGFLRGYAGGLVTVQTAEGNYRVPIVGRICMDQCMLDVTGIGAKEGDLVILFGHQPGDLNDLARRAGTISYESLCLVSARVPRITLENKNRRVKTPSAEAAESTAPAPADPLQEEIPL